MELKNLNPDGSTDDLPIAHTNLLHNWDFFAPVNARGIQSGTALTGADYWIDRWRYALGGITWTKGVGVALAAGAAIWQYIERPYAMMRGRTVTVSVRLADGTIKSVTGSFPASAADQTVTTRLLIGGVATVDLGLEYRSDGTLICGITQRFVPYVTISAISAVTIAAVKLELGTVGTLAQDPPMDYGAELLRCMRHYRRKYLSQYSTIGVYACGPTYCVIELPVGVPMRAKPTLRITGSIGFIGGAVPTIASEWNVNSQDPNCMEATSTASTSGAGYAYAADTGGILIEHIADL